MRQLTPILVLIIVALPSGAGEGDFSLGPVLDEYGPVASVATTFSIPADAEFRLSFDTSQRDANGGPMRTLVSAARFINMHARAGVALERMHLAVVVHGKAVKEMADEKSPSADLIGALTQHGVRIIVCGQSAVYYDVATEDLLPGVEMALSAMTAHALLQQQGYALNPF